MPAYDSPEQPAWRRSASKGTSKKKDSRSSPGPAGARGGWRNQEQPKKASNKRGVKRRIKLTLALWGVVGVIGLIVFLIWLLQPLRPSALIVLGSPAEENLALPVNVGGWKGLTELTEWIKQNKSDQGRKLPRVLGEEPKSLERVDEWDYHLKQYEGALLGSREKTVILYMALHGGTDTQGAFLMVDTKDGVGRIRVKDVIDRLGKLPTSTKKVLILDAVQTLSYWPAGVLHNDFARELEKLDPDIVAVPNLVVISSSGTDEQSWVSEEWQQSIFAHSLNEGFKGAADADKNFRISAWELYDYVQDEVKRWAQADREAKQTPVLLPVKEGKQRALEIELTAVVDTPRAKPSEAPGANFQAPAELGKSWEKAQVLRAEVPSPAVYAPQIWRQYLGTLLRYEQVLRMGDPRGRVGQLRSRLERLEANLSEARELNLASVTNALPMAAALGLSDSSEFHQKVEDDFKDLWNAKEDRERQDKWKQISDAAQSQPGGLERVQLKLAQILMNRVTTDPRIDREKVVALSRRLTPANRPAEMHFLAMYAHLTLNEIPRPIEGEAELPADLLRQAMVVRVLAERAALGGDSNPDARVHPYSEQVYPWVKDKVVAADRERRLGEDLLFAQAPAANATTNWWNEARTHLTKAQTLYEEARRTGEKVRRALHLRDQALAELPYYSLWVGRRHAANKEEVDETKKWVDRLEALWEGIHKLGLDLDKLEPKLLADPAVEALRENFDQIGEEFKLLVSKLGDDVIQDNWYRHEDALVVPFLDHTTRLQIINRSRLISDRLNQKSRENLQNLKPSQYSATDLAVRQGRMALATLPQRLVDNFLEESKGADDKVKSYGRLSGLIKQPGGDWWRDTNLAGEVLGRLWQELPTRALKQLDSSRSREDLKVAETELLLADLFAREADAAGASRFPLLPGDPTSELRRLRIHDLLLAQAGRTYRDHWYSEVGDPYYRTAGLKYVRDAEKLITQSSSGDGAPVEARYRPVREAEDQVKRLAGLGFSSPAKIDWTSELAITLDYDLTAKNEVLPGYPVLWRTIESEAMNKPLRVVDGNETDRIVAADFGADRPAPDKKATPDVKADFHLNLANLRLAEDEKAPPLVPTREPNVVYLKGVYRGQVLTRPVPVAIHRVPHNTALDFPRPTKGAVTVQADDNTMRLFGENVGVLSIVVDYSASMYTAMEPGGKTTRLNEARKALEKLLADIPDGPVVSVWMLGVDKRTNGVRGIEHLWPPEGAALEEYKWSRKKASQVAELLRNREPKDTAASPIAQAIGQAVDNDFDIARKNFQNDYAGFKTLLVLSDGDDNRFGDTPEKTPSPEERAALIRKYLKPRLENQDIQVNMVFFQGDPKLWPDKDRKAFEEEYARAKQQFGFIESLQPPGSIIESHRTDDLIDKLRRFRRQELNYQLEIREGQPLTGRGEKLPQVYLKGKPPSWSTLLLPGVYRAVVRSFAQRVEVGPGDFLQITLTRSDGKLECERVLLTDIYEARGMKEVDNWRFAVMNNAFAQGGGVEMTALLENTVVRPSKGDELGTILMPRPSFMWLEASGAGLPYPQPLWLRWGNREWLPAPAWTVQTGRWPSQPGGDGKARQLVNAWWITAQSAPPVAQSLPGRTKPVGQDDPAFTNRPIQVEGEDIVIESVRLEKRAIFLSTSTEDRKPATCLVVRLRHTKGKPVLARIVPSGGAFSLQGSEHRLYSDADKYTGIFWPVNESGGADFTLQLMSLDKIKSVALHAELDKLPAPLPGDQCPIPPVPHSGTGQ